MEIFYKNILEIGIIKPNGMNILKTSIHIARLLFQECCTNLHSTRSVGECLLSLQLVSLLRNQKDNIYLIIKTKMRA